MWRHILIRSIGMASLALISPGWQASATGQEIGPGSPAPRADQKQIAPAQAEQASHPEDQTDEPRIRVIQNLLASKEAEIAALEADRKKSAESRAKLHAELDRANPAERAILLRKLFDEIDKCMDFLPRRTELDSSCNGLRIVLGLSLDAEKQRGRIRETKDSIDKVSKDINKIDVLLGDTSSKYKIQLSSLLYKKMPNSSFDNQIRKMSDNKLFIDEYKMKFDRMVEDGREEIAKIQVDVDKLKSEYSNTMNKRSELNLELLALGAELDAGRERLKSLRKHPTLDKETEQLEKDILNGLIPKR